MYLMAGRDDAHQFHLLTSMHTYYHIFTLLSGAILNNEDSVQVYCIGAERYKTALLCNYFQ